MNYGAGADENAGGMRRCGSLALIVPWQQQIIDCSH